MPKEETKSPCIKCGETRWIKWENGKGYTCQKCGNFLIIDKTTGHEDPNWIWRPQ